MKKTLTALLIATLVAAQTGGIAAQTPPRPGEGIAPAAVGQPCTGPSALRGSTVAAQAKAGDVATVPQLCVGGVSAASLPHAPAIVPPATSVSDAELDRDQSLPPLVALGAPSGAAVDIRTVNGNWTHLFSGAFWRAPAITSKGELQAIDSGHAEFSVAAALGYFAVVMPRFLARVKGTIFDVDYEPGESASFSVTEGTVDVVRIIAIHLIEENRTIDGIRQTETINAGGKSTVQYHVSLQPERTFKNLNEATQEYNEELQAATTAGDPVEIDDALNNISVVTGKPIAGIAGASSAASGAGTTGAGASAAAGGISASTLEIIGIGLAVAGGTTAIVTSNSGSHSNATPQPQATSTGTVTLQSTGRPPALVPVPSPTPKPTPATVPPPPGPTKPK